jgi:two-component system OmpR family sensor kinase
MLKVVTVRKSQLLRRLRPVRNRLTLLATGLVALALAVAGAVLVLVLHRVLLSSADNANAARAAEVKRALSAGSLNQLDEALLATDQNIDLVQVLGPDGRVLASSRPDVGAALGAPLPVGRREVVDGAIAGPSTAEYRATRIGVHTRTDGDLTVEVGIAEAGLNRIVLVVTLLCAAVFPLIVVAMAALTHFFVGRTLEPVERIRRQVDEISGADLAQRVPEPETRDEIATLARTMNAMLARLQSAQRTQQRFVGDASHELNSPLTTVLGLLELATVIGEPVDIETVREVLLPEAERMRDLISDLSLLARADERGTVLRRAPVNLDELVRAEVARLTALGLPVRSTVVPARVHGDGDPLTRVLRNLVDNAARYARERLSLDMTISGTTVTVTVTDDGPGVPAADRERVFQRFVRLEPARERARGGSGLGLAIVAEIIAAHDGAVGVDSGPDGGAAFWFRLPLAPEHR